MKLENIILVIIGTLLFIAFISVLCSITSYMLHNNIIVITKGSVIPIEEDEVTAEKDIESCLETGS